MSGELYSLANCRISSDSQLFGLRSLVLENELIRTTILLDRGANIYECVLKSENHDFLFHHPRVKRVGVREGKGLVA